MAVNRDTKSYGGVRNRIHRIVTRTGEVNVQYADSYPDQTNSPYAIIDRTSAEPPVARSQQDTVKDSDI